MATTSIWVCPVAVLQAGQTYGPYVTPQIGGAYASIGYQISQGVGWPASGQVIWVQMEVSSDGGTTWTVLHSGYFDGGPWFSGVGLNKVPVTTATALATWHNIVDDVPVPVLTNPTDLYRITVKALQNCVPIIKFVGA